MESIEERAKRIVESRESIDHAAALDAAAVLWAYVRNGIVGWTGSGEIERSYLDSMYDAIQRTEGPQ